LLQALEATPAVVIGRSYGGEVAVELALRNPTCVRGLVLLEAASLTLDQEAERWNEELGTAVEAAAARDVASVAKTFLRRVLGDEQWKSFPDGLRQMFVGNSPAILAEVRGRPLEATAADLTQIAVPTLLVASEGSPPAFHRVTERMAAAIPDSRTAQVSGGHLIDLGEPGLLSSWVKC
jgi:pimeloyl-ACP methyl ester carboxylesterase